MEVLHPRCAGLDVHQETVVACVLYGPLDHKPKQQTQTFSTTTRGLLALHDWLSQHGCSHVAMEAQVYIGNLFGTFWRAISN